MNPLTSPFAGWVYLLAALVLGLACYYAAGIRKWHRNRRLDARIREAVRTASPEDAARWLLPASQRTGQ